MNYSRLRKCLIVIASILVVIGSNWAWSEVPHQLDELAQRLASTEGVEYIEVRKVALGLPNSAFDQFLSLLRQSPPYSLEHILALILEARAQHPEESARFDRDFQHMIENPDMSGRHGQPIYRIWRSREVREVHPLVYEAHIKIGVPPMPTGLFGMVSMPNPDNIPFILYLAKQHGPGALYGLVKATEGYPEERAWLRPLAVQMYKEYRQKGEVGASGVISMFQGFGTLQDLAILKDILEFEEALMPVQGFVLGDREEIGRTWYVTKVEYEKKKAALERSEREGAQKTIIQTRQQELEEAEAVAREATRQKDGEFLWRQINDSIRRLETRLARDEHEER